MKVFGIVGWSGSGCTDLLLRLSKYFSERGVKVSAVVQFSDESDCPSPQGDANRLHESGCVEALTVTPQHWMLSHKAAESGDFSLERTLENLEMVDLVLVEGFKQMGHPKIVVVHPKRERQLENTELLATACPHVVALAARYPVSNLVDLRLPILEAADTHSVARFIAEFWQLRLKASVTAIKGTS